MRHAFACTPNRLIETFTVGEWGHLLMYRMSQQLVDRLSGVRLNVRLEAAAPMLTMCSANFEMGTDASQPIDITKSDNLHCIRGGIPSDGRVILG